MKYSLLLVLATSLFSQVQHNVLSSDEEDANYELLFDGESLNKFKGYNKPSAPSAWEIVGDEDKAIKITKQIGSGHIFTKDATYLNFDLKTNWLVPFKGNSGIFIRYKEELGAWAGKSGPEAQVVDKNHSDGQKPKHLAGTCYDLFTLPDDVKEWSNGQNAWNEFRIIAYEDRIAHYGNGVKLIEYKMNSPEWTAAYNASKYKNEAAYKTIHAGAIYFQHHGETGIQYRNLKIKKLSENENPWSEGSSLLKPDGSGLIDSLPQAVALSQNYLHPPEDTSSAAGVLLLHPELSWFIKNQELQFWNPHAVKQVKLYHLSGKLARVAKMPMGSINVSSLSSGVYFVKADFHDGKKVLDKLVVP